MKRTYLLLLLITAAFPSIGQTFHAILIADTKDPLLGVSCEKDLAEMSVRLADIAKKVSYDYREIICSNEQFGNASLQKALADIACEPDDIVFFYYTGHGLNTLERKSTFPLLYLKDENSIELESVHLQLKSKKPRFCVTLGDCCNNLFTDTRSMRPVSPLFKGIGVTDDTNIVKKLFLETEGDIIISSAGRGEKATAHPNRGSFYTYSWMEALTYAESHNQSISWESLLKDAENRLQEALKEFPDTIKHHSHWSVGYNKAPVSDPSANKPVISFDEINKFLNLLANEQVSFSERNSIRIQKQSEYFESAATVDIYINSPEKPVERQPIDQFLKRIVSTAKLIEQFNFVEKMSTLSKDGKYGHLTLQEIR